MPSFANALPSPCPALAMSASSSPVRSRRGAIVPNVPEPSALPIEASTTPPITTAMPVSAHSPSSSPSILQANITVKTGASAITAIERRGPMRVKASNRAESPIASPTTPLNPIQSCWFHSIPSGQMCPVITRCESARQSAPLGRRSRLTVVTPSRRPAVVKNTLVQEKITAARMAMVSP